ncbi:MAG: phosphatase PAP2 family protein [Chloroflexi bacterium]|nr:phosphatase PAP2 family protein [Chloroflexota bacterium]
MTKKAASITANRITAIFLAVSYAVVTYLVATFRLNVLDLDATRAAQSVSSLPLDYVSSLLSLAGAAEVTVPSVLLGAFWLHRAGRRREAAGLLLLLVLVPLVVLFKSLIAQEGPGDAVEHRYTFAFFFPTADASSAFFSYPSGHVTRGTFLCAYTAFLVWRRPWPSPAKGMWLTSLGLVAVLMGITRVYSGEHWLTDVVGGYLLGGLAALLAAWLAARDSEAKRFA